MIETKQPLPPKKKKKKRKQPWKLDGLPGQTYFVTRVPPQLFVFLLVDAAEGVSSDS
jgi:hypothetical protein